MAKKIPTSLPSLTVPAGAAVRETPGPRDPAAYRAAVATLLVGLGEAELGELARPGSGLSHTVEVARRDRLTVESAAREVLAHLRIRASVAELAPPRSPA